MEGEISKTPSEGRSRQTAQRQPSTEAYGSDGDNTQQQATTQPEYCGWRQSGQPALGSGLPVKGAHGFLCVVYVDVSQCLG